MADFVYNSYKGALFSGLINTTTMPLYVALVTSSYSPNDNHTVYSDFSGAEVANGSGYTTRGVLVSSPTVTVDTGSDLAVLDSSSDIVWASSTITASGAVLYASGTVGSLVHPLIAYFDFGGNHSSSNGSFTLEFSSSGIMRIING